MYTWHSLVGLYHDVWIYIVIDDVNNIANLGRWIVSKTPPFNEGWLVELSPKIIYIVGVTIGIFIKLEIYGVQTDMRTSSYVWNPPFIVGWMAEHFRKIDHIMYIHCFHRDRWVLNHYILYINNSMTLYMKTGVSYQQWSIWLQSSWIIVL
jgi:hypothetical protein